LITWGRRWPFFVVSTSADEAYASAQIISKEGSRRDRFDGFWVRCDLSLAERSPGHSVGAIGRRGCEGVNDSSREGILFPRGSGGTSSVTSVTSFCQWRRTTRLLLLMEVLEKCRIPRKLERQWIWAIVGGHSEGAMDDHSECTDLPNKILAPEILEFLTLTCSSTFVNSSDHFLLLSYRCRQLSTPPMRLFHSMSATPRMTTTCMRAFALSR